MNILKSIFKFASSVRLAIPTMGALLIAAIIGTLCESQYNAEYAAIQVYKTWWFSLILALLWINILFAALSRYPYKKHHTGFLITHLGLLILLGGSVITLFWGIDGTMQVVEKSESSVVFLQSLVVEKDNVKVPFKRKLAKGSVDGLEIFGPELKFTKYLPFVSAPERTFASGVNLNFKIKNRFFDVIQTLNSVEQREVSMGPATFRMMEREQNAALKSVKTVKTQKAKKGGGPELIISNIKDQSNKNYTLENGKIINLNNIKISIKNIFHNAQIVNNKIAEGDPAGNNPAVELEVVKGSEKKREILYAKIPEFSLNPNGLFDLKFKLSGESEAVLPVTNNANANANANVNFDRTKNTAEFVLINENPLEVEVSLYKENKLIEKKLMKIKDSYETPWMGITITLLNYQPANVETEVEETDIQPKMPFPPSAMLVELANGQKSWITENSQKSFFDGTKDTFIYYGRERLILPFSVFLERFEKKDYPGVDMAMNYKSFVKVNNQGPVIEIAMNEPLKYDGYTIYQSSYSLTPGEPALSVFSVNRDPGRPYKYIGSIILCIGIIVYTLMKSNFYRKFNRKGEI